MEKEEKKFVNKAEEDEMVVNSVHVFLYSENPHIFLVFSLNGVCYKCLSWEMQQLALTGR